MHRLVDTFACFACCCVGTLLMMSAARAGEPVALPSLPALHACESLASLNLSTVADQPAKISSVKRIESRVGVFCQIHGSIQPSITFEVDLPLSGWQQRYLQTGCGGLCGDTRIQVSHAGSCQLALQGGLAVASDDMGHQETMGGGAFGADPQKRIDFAYRANHVTALLAKALIKEFYGQAPRHSYFSGCSDGGREALVEAERFPDDFDGIAAGAPAMNFQVQNSFYHAWQYRSNTATDGTHILLADKLPVLHRAAVAACDAADGLKDGLISDPRGCRFDPAVAQCPAGKDARDCLTAAEVAVARKLYAGPTDAAGHHFTIGGPQPGSELSWAGVFVPATKDAPVMSKMAAAAASQYLIFPEVSSAAGDIDHFEFTQKHFAALAALHPLYDATDPNLAPFMHRGGKLLLWHGWSDPHISPINTVAYFHEVGRLLGTGARDTFARLFLFPGMYHCDGGDGFSQFDVLTPLMAWVERGAAPDKIIAAQVAARPMGPPPQAGPPAAPLPPADARVLRSRPVFPYPSVARYSGQGSVDDAANFIAADGAIADPDSYTWEGQDFYKPNFLERYAPRDGRLVVAPH